MCTRKEKAMGRSCVQDILCYKFGINANVIGAFDLNNIPASGANNLGIYFKL